MMIKLYVESHLLVVVILAIRAVCVIKLYVESTIPTSNLGFCAVSCPDEVLCAVDGDCETYGDFLRCCGSGGSIPSTRFCWDKRLRCPSADDVLCAEDGDCGDLLMQCCPP
eukprot:208396_1